MEITRTFDFLEQLKEKYAHKKDILAQKKNGIWFKVSVDDYYETAHTLSYGFLALGLQAQDKVITITNNRPEWNFIDMGLGLANLIHVPIYPTLSVEDYKCIIEHSDAKLIIIENETIFNIVNPAVQELEYKPIVYTINTIEGQKNLEEIKILGTNTKNIYSSIIEENKKNIKGEDLCTIIYTSGTAGHSKGVMLSHRAITFNAMAHGNTQIIDDRHRMLSFLPLCHIYERSMNYAFQYLGVSIYYVENLNTIFADLKDGNVNGFCAVPHILEMLLEKIRSAGKDLEGFKKKIYFWAFNAAEKYDSNNQSAFYKLKYKIADRLIYSKWRAKLGGNELLIISGGTAVQPKIIRLFTAAKMRIVEGYGLTETSPFIAFNRPNEHLVLIDSVGKIVDGIEVKLAADGEILTKGVCLMEGYYKDTEHTHRVIDDEGWFHTGDMGELTKDGFLRITDRKKDIFKLSSGEYIAPQLLENKFKESPFIENMFIIGENQKFVSAIISPNFNYLHFWGSKYKLHYRDNDELVENPKIIQRLKKEIDAINQTLASHEQIKRFRLVHEEWSPTTGELSPTFKLKRETMKKKYQTLINEIYESHFD
ncbi:MAG TPA: long-chain fatty acid--CoA ligase [Bacteroidales bacterium]|jgi:long-chain acyl-CoA synthetase|nr:long-chain fatty acid--CoA ligase [Bacteroidales bacterium]